MKGTEYKRRDSLPATAAAPATISATPSFTRSHRTRLGNSHIPSAVFCAIEFLNGVGGFLITRHLDKAEPFAASGVAIGDDLRGFYASCLSKDFLKRFVRAVER